MIAPNNPWRERWRTLDVMANTVFWFNDTWERSQTVSQHAAVEAGLGRRFGCWLCRQLSRWVEPDHCRLSLLPSGEPVENN